MKNLLQNASVEITGTLSGTPTSGTFDISNLTLTLPSSQHIVQPIMQNPSITDMSGAHVIMTFAGFSSAVNFLQAINANTGGSPAILATGSNTDVSLNLRTKGAGILTLNTVEVPTISSASTLSNKTLDNPLVTGTMDITGTGTLLKLNYGPSARNNISSTSDGALVFDQLDWGVWTLKSGGVTKFNFSFGTFTASDSSAAICVGDSVTYTANRGRLCAFAYPGGGAIGLGCPAANTLSVVINDLDVTKFTANGITVGGIIDQVGFGMSLFRNIAYPTAGGSSNGNGGNNIGTSYMGTSPMAATDWAQYSISGVAGCAYGTGIGYFGVPTTMVWRGTMTEIVAAMNYGFFIGDNGSTDTLGQDGYGIRVIDANTLQLVVRVSGVNHTQNVTVTGFVPTGSTPGRQWIVLRWDGVSVLSVYASFAATGGTLPIPTLRGSITQAASGAMHDTILRWGVYSTGTSTFTIQPGLMTTSMFVRDDQ